MTEREFSEYITYKSLQENGTSYGLCPPPCDPQLAVNILCEHFLGSNWYIVMPVGNEQANTEIVAEILSRYPGIKERKLSYKIKKLWGLMRGKKF